MSAIMTDPTYPLTSIKEPGANDVMCGRGGGTNNHIGNRRFRMLVNEHKHRYTAATKLDKPKVARELMALWRKQDPPGRFLTKDSKTNSWRDVGDQKAREKASQCLRERRTPSDVLPFFMSGRKKKMKELMLASGETVTSSYDEEDKESEDEAESEVGGEESSPSPRRKVLPRMEQFERQQQLEKMQQEQMKLHEMKQLLFHQHQQQQKQQQQQQQQQEFMAHIAKQQRIFPRQIARSHTFPLEMESSMSHQMMGHANGEGQVDMSMPPPAPQISAPNTPLMSNMSHLQSGQFGAVRVLGLEATMPRFQRTMTSPETGWDDTNGQGSLRDNFRATTAAAAAFRLDLSQKYGLGIAEQLLSNQSNGLEGSGNVSTVNAIGVGSGVGASSAFSSMRSLEFEDLKEWAEISGRSLGPSSRNLGVEKKLSAEYGNGAQDSIADDGMDWMKSFKSLSSSNKEALASQLSSLSPGNSLRNIMNAVDENAALQHIQHLGFSVEEQSLHSWAKNSASRKNANRRQVLEKAKKLNSTSATSMMSELSDLSADLVALDLAAMES